MLTRVIATQLLFLSLAIGITGCGPKQPDFPELIPVKGTVKKGKETISGGTIQFAPEGILPFIISSPVGTDGSFSLVTKRTGPVSEERPGAPAGKHFVSYLPASGSSGAPVIFVVPTIVKAGEDVVIDLTKAGDPKKAPPTPGGNKAGGAPVVVGEPAKKK
jgi:hypothetical protein